MSKIEIYDSTDIQNLDLAIDEEKIIYGKLDNSLKFIDENGVTLINSSPILGAGHIDLVIAKMQYGSVSLTTDDSGNATLISPFPVTFSSDVKTFVVSQFSGAGVARVKGGNISLANFSISLEGGTASSTYVCKWIAIGV